MVCSSHRRLLGDARTAFYRLQLHIEFDERIQTHPLISNFVALVGAERMYSQQRVFVPIDAPCIPLLVALVALLCAWALISFLLVWLRLCAWGFLRFELGQGGVGQDHEAAISWDNCGGCRTCQSSSWATKVAVVLLWILRLRATSVLCVRVRNQEM